MEHHKICRRKDYRNMKGNDRRERILQILSDSTSAISGANLAKQLDVSRQVIVQDMALLRANGTDIVSTNLGYVLNKKTIAERVLKVIHTEDEVEEELNIIIDLGGIVKDVFVYHKAYGVVRADMNIRFRKDVKTFVDNIKSGKSSLLMNVTSGYHYHTILAENEETLDMIFDALSERGFLAALQDYEPVDFWKTEG